MPSATIESGMRVDDVFDPKIHLSYEPPKRVYTLADLKLNPQKFSTPVAATEPFPFLSKEGISAYRRALFNTETLNTCSRTPFPKTLMVRNAASRSQFLHDLWSHPDTIRIMSEAMMAPLKPINRMEEGFVSLQVESEQIEDMKREVSVELRHEKIPIPEDDDVFDPLSTKSIIPWHFDSFPFACIVMLSETEGMIGGETYIKRGDGKIEKVAGPKLGCAYIIQGWMLEHLASRATGVKERIASVTSFRVDAPGHYDESFTTNLRGVDESRELQKEWAQYRLEFMKSEIERALDGIRDEAMSIAEFREFGANQARYMQRTYRQMVPWELTSRVLEKYGSRTYYGVATMWSEIRRHSDFQERAIAAMEKEWLCEESREYEGDLASSRLALRSGKALMGQAGYVKLDEGEAEYFTLGDELLRQGQKELFLEWADKWGFLGLI